MKGIVLALLLVAAASCPAQTRLAEENIAAGGVTVYARADVVEAGKPLPLAVDGSNGLKLAFQTRGSDNATFTMREETTGKSE